jgi:hypothetical protein
MTHSDDDGDQQATRQVIAHSSRSLAGGQRLLNLWQRRLLQLLLRLL